MTLLALLLALAPPPPAAVSVMTYNVHFRLAGDRATLDAIADAGVDAVFLQETNPRWERALRRRVSKQYPHMAFRHHGRAGGMAVLSKYPFEDIAWLPSPTGKFPAWLVVLDTPLGQLQALNVHLRPTRPDAGSWVRGYFATQPARLREARAHAAALTRDLPTLILGDFNEHLGGQAVTWWLEQGFRSAVEPFVPNTPTWRWSTPQGEVRWPLDHILHGQGLRPVAGEVREVGRSDHLPVVASFVANAAS